MGGIREITKRPKYLGIGGAKVSYQRLLRLYEAIVWLLLKGDISFEEAALMQDCLNSIYQIKEDHQV